MLLFIGGTSWRILAFDWECWCLFGEWFRWRMLKLDCLSEKLVLMFDSECCQC